MANKTRKDILAQIYEYIPQINVSSHETLVDNLCDLAAEEISMRHNFRALAGETPAEHTIEADDYYIDETDFSFTNFKELRSLIWLNSTTGEHALLTWKPQEKFQRDHSYLDYSGVTSGKPRFYTRIGTRYFFNCPFDEEVTGRAWYQKVHGDFADDDAVHLFSPDNMGFQAIIACVLAEIQEALPGMDVSKKAIASLQKKEYWIGKLIDMDIIKANETIEMGENTDSEGSRNDTNPYGWV